MNRRLHPPERLTDERFVARLGIVSVQSRLAVEAASTRRWSSQFTVGGYQYHVEGFAADFGRPRGIDTDLLIAIETLFER